jgi:outer membrane protein OmpA-like peptidoglycan-associated protein
LNIPGKSLMKGHVNILFGDGRPLGATDLQIKPPEVSRPPGPVKKIQQDDRITYRIPQELLFDFDKYELKTTPGTKNLTGRLYNALMLIGGEMGGVTYTGNDRYLVVGHTDNVGSDAYNMKLSRKRAETVANWFVAHRQTRREFIKAIGEGKTKPIDSNATVWGRANNRRVEVEAIRKDIWESL